MCRPGWDRQLGAAVSCREKKPASLLKQSLFIPLDWDELVLGGDLKDWGSSRDQVRRLVFEAACAVGNQVFIFPESLTVLAFGDHSQRSLGLGFSFCSVEMALRVRSEGAGPRWGRRRPEVRRVKKGQKEAAGLPRSCWWWAEGRWPHPHRAWAGVPSAAAVGDRCAGARERALE